MSDYGKIILGLVGFLVLCTSPFWYQVLSSDGLPAPELKLPVGEQGCVESKEYMRALHMDLLNRWRDAVVRDGERIYVSTSGREYQMSLTGTCLGCHTSRADFCDQCHTYVGSENYCWSCHVEPINLRVEAR
ncbi:MAG: sulfate reduction electron transfer complex DsrMKJOP subunit DsrJ [Acidobacteriota bacterium]|nr:MAG: sulfate reduction electron transfer complex DsrMKJOP subunit DsrJ [Acidobacteriota bacterium]